MLPASSFTWAASSGISKDGPFSPAKDLKKFLKVFYSSDKLIHTHLLTQYYF